MQSQQEILDTEQIREQISRITEALNRQAKEIHDLMERLSPVLADLEQLRKRWAWMIPKSR